MRIAIGAMSGTSIDGIDAAIVRIEGMGLDMRASLLQVLSAPLGGLAPQLRAIADQQPVTAETSAALGWELGLLHAQLIERLLCDCDESPAIIAVHGQTVFHKPPVSWQLINDAPIRARWPEASVFSDLRQDDLARGGEGAPITPLADWTMFRNEQQSRAIINLGGFCNATILPRPIASSQRAVASPQRLAHDAQLRHIAGFDICACNHILDAIARETMGVPFDEDGQRALRGTPNDTAVEKLLAILLNQRIAKRSLGTGDEAGEWVARWRRELQPKDLAATAAHAIGKTIATVIKSFDVEQVIVAGGGAMNGALLRAIEMHIGCVVITSEACGVPVQAREAMAMAVLGALRADGISITLPQVTGRTD